MSRKEEGSMIKDYSFKCSVATYIVSYIEYKQKTGRHLETIFYTMLTFDRFLQKMQYTKEYVDKNIIDAWLDSMKNLSCATYHRKVLEIRRFLYYMSRLGVDNYIPQNPPPRYKEHPPYIFTHDEMERIFSSCDSLRLKQFYPRSLIIAVPAYIRLLYSTAIRTSEALSINNGDVDFSRHIILLRQTKNGSQRLAPLNPSMEKVLKEYMAYRDRMPIKGLSDAHSPLFVNLVGKRCDRGSMGHVFRRVLTDAGISLADHGKGPSLHSLRYTACVHSFVKMFRAGKSLHCSLPILSSFMGHRKVFDTEYYLRLTQEMFPELNVMDLNVTNCINEIVKQSLNPYKYNNSQNTYNND
jgi:site-specific recombinase XerD